MRWQALKHGQPVPTSRQSYPNEGRFRTVRSCEAQSAPGAMRCNGSHQTGGSRHAAALRPPTRTPGRTQGPGRRISGGACIRPPAMRCRGTKKRRVRDVARRIATKALGCPARSGPPVLHAGFGVPHRPRQRARFGCCPPRALRRRALACAHQSSPQCAAPVAQQSCVTARSRRSPVRFRRAKGQKS